MSINPPTPQHIERETLLMTLRLNSPAFTQNAKIPNQFSRDGGNVSPPIEWQGAPAGTRSYAHVLGCPMPKRALGRVRIFHNSLKANAGYRVVSVVARLTAGQPVAAIDLMKGTEVKEATEKL
jgi:hypothetical protein